MRIILRAVALSLLALGLSPPTLMLYLIATHSLGWFDFFAVSVLEVFSCFAIAMCYCLARDNP